jgi:hypothetical protein
VAQVPGIIVVLLIWGIALLALIIMRSFPVS